MKAQKTQTTFWKCQGWENYNVIIVSRIIHVKVDRRLNVTNSNTKDDFQVVFLLSCFVGHPVCILQCIRSTYRVTHKE